MRDFLIYVENALPPESPYHVSEQAIISALGPLAAASHIKSCSATFPDYSALERADYFVGSGFDTGRLKAHGKQLRIVHCTSAGVEKYMPLDWLPNGAVLTNSSGVHARKGGAFGLMTVLMLCEGVPRHIENQRRHRWDNRLATGIETKTIVFVGFGALGSAIAERLRPLGATIVAVTRTGEAGPSADQVFAVSELERALPLADCLVVSCPLTASTRGLIGEAQLALLKPGASLFNIARGPVVDTKALARGLLDGRLSGAALDVFDREPLPADSDLWDVPNLMIFPHISCDDADGYVDRCLSIFADNVSRDLRGEPLRNRVDAVAGY
ncbi:D-2-hydroxyacid dehydrogenase [Ensifer adhaerens]|uniref:D-2-hydroxyacid dehydrogenase n=1 Tax=Ensifer adhaerens TaxID=106592 RepID=A0A9Q9DE37_ENSAD|nr:D-2-hydroxyacid dehydrogenase [Ensifer adhaerens]USJ27986.1 D-2-hydroxyacid dehydrogenase [Ensifer adhaerens]